ncbi:MAG: cobalamin-independent methionine synthase II family protein [Planctomycetota bacterium]|nr:cobalamin-independent methionine synthase II family protein [Planctomycetota bacterium]MDA1214792.1 cobalamin-independent methionine synthase II family protein [Planctomycetota bacterium]
MREPLPLFPATVIGSMPRPQYIKDLLKTGSRTGDHDDRWQTKMDNAIRYVIDLQEQAGIDLISDGEWRRESYVDVVSEIMSGFRWITRDQFAYHQVIVEPMKPLRPGVVAEEAKFLKENTDRHVKVCLPSPYLLGQRMWEPEHSKSAYATREHFCEALVPVLRQELLAIRDVGVDVIQLDEPHLCVLVDPEVRAKFADPETEMQRAVDWLNQIVEGIDGVQLSVHLCRRNWGRRGWGAVGGYEAILAHINRLKVKQLMLEFSIPVAGDMAILTQLQPDIKIGLGCVDVRFPDIDTSEQIVERVQTALKYVAPDRITLNPDCGFAPGKDHEVPLEEAYLKLKAEADAARKLRELYS